MTKLPIILLILAFISSPILHAQKKKNKGGGKNNGDINININIDQGKDDKDHNDFDGDHGKKHKGDHNNDGHPDNGWHHGHNKHHKEYGNQTVIWFFGPGDIYECKGKGKKEKIVVFDQVCVRLSTNIGFMFGLLGDLRIKLDSKKSKMKPERFDKLKIEIDLLDDELKLIEIKKNKIKLRLKKLKEEKDKD